MTNEGRTTLRGLGYEPAAQKNEAEPESSVPTTPPPKRNSHPGEYSMVPRKKERVLSPAR